MAFDVLDAHGENRKRWSSLVEDLDPRMRDIHFLPEYALVYEQTYGDQARLAVYESPDGCMIQPFLKRQLNALAFLQQEQITDPVWDIANPYGFGGPAWRCGPNATSRLFREFDENFRAWCRTERIASEFCSLHPLLENHRPLMHVGAPQLALEKEVVYIDLTRGEEGIRAGLRKGHRSSIQKARRSGVRVEQVPAQAGTLADFRRLYDQTMERNMAADRWRFPADYFGNCREFLGDARVSLFFARVGGELAAAAIVMHDFDTVYYHFSGSDERLYEYCANNLLVFEIAVWASGRGLRRFHLGGGVGSSPDDRLRRFKAGFSEATAPLYTYGRVHHEATYALLCDLKAAHEARTGIPSGREKYFPMYRR